MNVYVLVCIRRHRRHLVSLAALAGIRVAETKAIRMNYGHAVAIKRFDRIKNQRMHTLSAYVALNKQTPQSLMLYRSANYFP